MKVAARIVDAPNEPRSTLDFIDDQKGARRFLQRIAGRFDRDQAMKA